MTRRIIWAGEYYQRGKGNNTTWRNRRTGEVIRAKPTVINREGNNRIILPSKNTFIGVEKTRMHFSGKDKKPILLTGNKIKKLQVRVRENKPSARKKRSSHTRTLK